MNIKVYFLSILICAVAPFALAAQSMVTFDLTLVTANSYNYTFTDSGSSLKMDLSTTDDWATFGTGFAKYTNNQGLEVFDGHNLSMTFVFDQDVRITGYEVGYYVAGLSGDEAIILTGSGHTSREEGTAKLWPGTKTFENQFTLKAGDSLVLTSWNPTDGGASSAWKSLSVTVVPEPATYALLLGGLVLAGAILRRRFRR